MNSNKITITSILFTMMIGTSCLGQKIDTLQYKSIADSLMRIHSVSIPKEYIEKLEFKYLEPGKPIDWIFRNFKNYKFSLDTIGRMNYAFIYHYRIGEFSGENISIIISEDNNSDNIQYYFPETPFLFLKSIKNKEKSFAALTKNNVIELIESNGEVRIDSLKEVYDWHFKGWDTLAKKTYFVISYNAIVTGGSEENNPEFKNKMATTNDLENIKTYTPIFMIQSDDPIVCIVSKGGYGIARKHRIYFDVNTMLLLYDGFPSFRFFVIVDKF